MVVKQSAIFIRFELILLLFFTISMYSISFQNTDFGVLQNTSKHFLASICIPSMERQYFGTPGCNKRFPRFPPKRIIVRCILTGNGIIRLLPYRACRLMLVRGSLRARWIHYDYWSPHPQYKIIHFSQCGPYIYEKISGSFILKCGQDV